MDAGPAGIHDNGLDSLLSVEATSLLTLDFVAAFAITVYYCNFKKIKNKLINTFRCLYIMVSQPSVEAIERYPLSDTDIRKVLGKDCKIIRYGDLDEYQWITLYCCMRHVKIVVIGSVS